MLHNQIPVVLAQFGGGAGQLLFFALLFGVMYFVLIRPQQKQAKEHAAMVAALKKGDDVITQGGLLGKVFAVADKTVTLELAAGVKVRILKSSVQTRGTVSDEAKVEAKPDEAAKKEEK